MRPDCVFKAITVHGERRWIDIDQHRRRSGQLHRRNCRHRGVRHCQDRVSRPHSTGPERQLQRVGSVGRADRVTRSQVVGELALEPLHFPAQNV